MEEVIDGLEAERKKEQEIVEAERLERKQELEIVLTWEICDRFKLSQGKMIFPIFVSG